MTIQPHEILLLGPGTDGGGAEMRFSYWAKHLFSGGAKIAVLSPSRSRLASNYVVVPRYGRFRFARAVRFLSRFIRDHRIRLVMSLGLYPNLYAYFSSVLSGSHPSLIFSEITQPLKSLLFYRGHPQSYFQYVAYQLTYRRADLVLSNSDSARRELVEHFGTREETTRWIPNTIDTARIRAGAATEPSIGIEEYRTEGCKVLVTAGRLDTIKQYDRLLKAVNILSQKIPARLFIIGDGPERGRLLRLIERLGLSKSAVITGWVKNPFSLIRQGDLYLCTSKSEGCPNAVLEAMAIGVPVLSTACTSEILKASENGACVVLGDSRPEVWASQLFAFFQTGKDKIAQMVLKASAFVETYDFSRSIPFIQALIDDFLSMDKEMAAPAVKNTNL